MSSHLSSWRADQNLIITSCDTVKWGYYLDLPAMIFQELNMENMC